MRPLATVRARTALGASLALGVALYLGASASGGLLRRSLIKDLDQVAEVRAADIAGLTGQGPLPDVLPGPAGVLVQVVDPEGRTLAVSEGAAGPPLADLHPAPGRFEARTVARLPGGLGRPDEYRVLALRTTAGPDPPVVYVATPLDDVEHSVAVLRRVALLALPVLLALVALTAWLAVGRALQPVESIRAEVADISARELDRRVPESPADDEVARLARTMNAMLDRLERSAERQRRFVADASEELGAPLAVTTSQLEAALRSPPEEGWPAAAAELLRRHRRMETLVRDLLYLARVDAGAPRAPMAPVDLDDVVVSEVARLRGGPVRFETTAVSAAPVHGRAEDLRRGVRNLLEHAERNAHTVVRVGLSTADDGQVTLVVEDDGDEVLPEERDLIFERFTHLPAASGATETGSGLGLAIVRDIALAHGGRVSVEAARPGSRFLLYLPGPPDA